MLAVPTFMNVEKKQKQQKLYFLVLTFIKTVNCIMQFSYKIRNTQNFKNKTKQQKLWV